MNERQLTQVITTLAEGLVPAEADLWPAIRARFEASQPLSNTGDLSMENKFNQTARPHHAWQIMAIVCLALLAVAGLVAALPQGRAWAQEMLRFFARAGSDTLPVQSFQLTPLPTPGTPTPDPSSIQDVHQTIDEVQGQAGYKLMVPATVPDSLSLVGASFQADHKIARIFYRDADMNSLVIAEEPFIQTEACDLCGKVGASAQVEMVTIGAASGEYVQGTWKLTDKGPVWESDPYLQRIRWQANSTAFEILYMGIPDALTKTDLIAIAQSLK